MTNGKQGDLGRGGGAGGAGTDPKDAVPSAPLQGQSTAGTDPITPATAAGGGRAPDDDAQRTSHGGGAGQGQQDGGVNTGADHAGRSRDRGDG